MINWCTVRWRGWGAGYQICCLILRLHVLQQKYPEKCRFRAATWPAVHPLPYISHCSWLYCLLFFVYSDLRTEILHISPPLRLALSLCLPLCPALLILHPLPSRSFFFTQLMSLSPFNPSSQWAVRDPHTLPHWEREKESERERDGERERELLILTLWVIWGRMLEHILLSKAKL